MYILHTYLPKVECGGHLGPLNGFHKAPKQNEKQCTFAVISLPCWNVPTLKECIKMTGEL